MAQTTYQVILSTDGKHTVIATTDDKAIAKSVFGWAKATYDRVVEICGTKADPYQKANGNNNGQEKVPVCAVHHAPMTLVKGRKGDFYSCHVRENGEWCKYRPESR